MVTNLYMDRVYISGEDSSNKVGSGISMFPTSGNCVGATLNNIMITNFVGKGIEIARTQRVRLSNIVLQGPGALVDSVGLHIGGLTDILMVDSIQIFQTAVGILIDAVMIGTNGVIEVISAFVKCTGYSLVVRDGPHLFRSNSYFANTLNDHIFVYSRNTLTPIINFVGGMLYGAGVDCAGSAYVSQSGFVNSALRVLSYGWVSIGNTIIATAPLGVHTNSSSTIMTFTGNTLFWVTKAFDVTGRYSIFSSRCISTSTTSTYDVSNGGISADVLTC
eukprot:TRINITY_DN11282_c0_g1_i2.p1 TRINITY_DN11282_c0_g1~~TRINITY_DN11282_c0_g1_i2.p1  ORF type:complete len:290 (+),score=25.68 TRINITY_DN11282_c0_g1_i2:45-872(+)